MTTCSLIKISMRIYLMIMYLLHFRNSIPTKVTEFQESILLVETRQDEARFKTMRDSRRGKIQDGTKFKTRQNSRRYEARLETGRDETQDETRRDPHLRSLVDLFSDRFFVLKKDVFLFRRMVFQLFQTFSYYIKTFSKHNKNPV